MSFLCSNLFSSSQYVTPYTNLMLEDIGGHYLSRITPHKGSLLSPLSDFQVDISRQRVSCVLIDECCCVRVNFLAEQQG